MCSNNEIVKKEKSSAIPVEEKQFYKDVREILLQARELSYKNASEIMTQAYWNVGKRIVEQELCTPMVFLSGTIVTQADNLV